MTVEEIKSELEKVNSEIKIQEKKRERLLIALRSSDMTFEDKFKNWYKNAELKMVDSISEAKEYTPKLYKFLRENIADADMGDTEKDIDIELGDYTRGCFEEMWPEHDLKEFEELLQEVMETSYIGIKLNYG